MVSGGGLVVFVVPDLAERIDRKSTRLNSSHQIISYAVFCLKKKKDAKRMRRSGASGTATTNVAMPIGCEIFANMPYQEARNSLHTRTETIETTAAGIRPPFV